MQLISHRLRNFDLNDATEIGLRNAISKGVKFIEVDLRITKDNELVINHDPHLIEHFSTNKFIYQLTLIELKKINFNKNSCQSILTFDRLIEIFSEISSETILCLDIKEFGLEEKIISKLEKFNLNSRIVIISWLPQVLFKINKLNPALTLCFSYIPIHNFYKFHLFKMIFDKLKLTNKLGRISSFIKIKKFQHYNYTTLFFDDYNQINLLNNEMQKGFDSEHLVSDFLQNDLLKILQQTNGWICVPYKLIDENFVIKYKNLGIKVCVFTIKKKKTLQFILQKIKPDFILTDNPKLIFNNEIN